MIQAEIVRFHIQYKNNGDTDVYNFGRIPQGWANKLDQHPQDEEVAYWCNDKEWLALGAGESFEDFDVLACACDECELEREVAL